MSQHFDLDSIFEFDTLNGSLSEARLLFAPASWFGRDGGDHHVFKHPARLGRIVPRHRILSPGVARAIASRVGSAQRRRSAVINSVLDPQPGSELGSGWAGAHREQSGTWNPALMTAAARRNHPARCVVLIWRRFANASMAVRPSLLTLPRAEGIKNKNTRWLEICNVARDHSEALLKRRACDHKICAVVADGCTQMTPTPSHLEIK